ncbi:MAG: peptidylprolyl isomerase [Bryobacteraceae bacterium]
MHRVILNFAGLLLIAASNAHSQTPEQAVLHGPESGWWSEKAPAQFRVRVETTQGFFTIECRREWAPRGVDRFYNLLRAGFYDDSRLFRVRAGFIVQFGIPGDPSVGRIWRTQQIPDDPRRVSNTRGRVAFAMTGPSTRTTQLFISLADNSRLDQENFAPIGEVVDGMGVVDRGYAGYGETSGGGMRGGKQDPLFENGNSYLDREYPKLDRLIRAVILPVQR